MYSSKGDYYADLGVMRNEASVIAAGVRKTRSNIATYRYTLNRFQDDGALIHLHFTMPNLYLQAVQVVNGNDNHLYRFYGSGFNLHNVQLHTQTFTEDYAAMGWNKSVDALTVTLDDVNTACFEFIGGVPGKSSFRTLVVAFAEGFRFDKIARKVATGEAIGGKELDWSAPGATVYEGP